MTPQVEAFETRSLVWVKLTGRPGGDFTTTEQVCVGYLEHGVSWRVAIPKKRGKYIDGAVSATRIGVPSCDVSIHRVDASIWTFQEDLADARAALRKMVTSSLRWSAEQLSLAADVVDSTLFVKPTRLDTYNTKT